MPSPRRLTVLLTAGLLATGPAAAWGQSAGDAQYEDPFGQADAGRTTAQEPADAPPLTATPPGGDGSGVDPGSTTPPPPAESPTGATGSQTNTPPVRELPRTGLDTRTVVLLGLALTLGGIGLRLRTADVRF